MERCRIWIRAAVARDDMQLRDGYVEGRFIGIFEKEKLHLAFAHIHIDKAVVATDSVLRMDDWIALAQLGQIAHHSFDVTRALLVAFAASRRATVSRVEVVFC